jgi:hypothetical protein
MCFLFSRSEEVTVAKVAAAVKAAAAEEAAMVKVAEEVAVVNAVEEAMARTTTEEFMAVKSAAEATAVAGPDSSDGGSPIAVRTDTRGTPDVTPDYKALGKRPATMTGSIGTNPPPPPQSLSQCLEVCHACFANIFSFFFPLFAQVF